MSVSTEPVRLRMVFRMCRDVLRVSAIGELDLDSASPLASLVFASIEPSCAEVRVDLSACTFADTAGVRGLLRCNDEAAARGCSFTVEHPSAAARLALELTGADRQLQIVE
jgi:anti-anti-sigma factor